MLNRNFYWYNYSFIKFNIFLNLDSLGYNLLFYYFFWYFDPFCHYFFFNYFHCFNNFFLLYNGYYFLSNNLNLFVYWNLDIFYDLYFDNFLLNNRYLNFFYDLFDFLDLDNTINYLLYCSRNFDNLLDYSRNYNNFLNYLLYLNNLGNLY